MYSKDSPSQNSEPWQTLQRSALAEIARRNPDSCLDWALAHRVIRGRLLELTPALRDLYADDYPRIVVQKAAQVGVSEWLTSLGLWAADTGQGGRGHVFYVMPTENNMRDFTQARIDRAIAESPHLKSRVGTLSKVDRSPDRTALKRVGPGYIYFRGSDPRQLASVDADVVILDEFDQMDDQVLSLALQRLASSKLGWIRVASTPRLPEAGVNGLFRQSDQRRYRLPCPKCGTRQLLTWEENVDLERALLVCSSRRCRAPMSIWAEGEWVATASENNWRGYHLNRLYSPLANLEEMIVESQSSGPYAQTAFQNQVLGEVFVPSGSGLTLTDLDKCRREYSL